MMLKERVETPVLEQIECICGSVMLDSKCLNPDCETAAKQALPKQSMIDSVSIAAPNAFTIRGSVD